MQQPPLRITNRIPQRTISKQTFNPKQGYRNVLSAVARILKRRVNAVTAQTVEPSYPDNLSNEASHGGKTFLTDVSDPAKAISGLTQVQR